MARSASHNCLGDTVRTSTSYRLAAQGHSFLVERPFGELLPVHPRATVEGRAPRSASCCGGVTTVAVGIDRSSETVRGRQTSGVMFILRLRELLMGPGAR